MQKRNYFSLFLLSSIIWYPMIILTSLENDDVGYDLHQMILNFRNAASIFYPKEEDFDNQINDLLIKTKNFFNIPDNDFDVLMRKIQTQPLLEFVHNINSNDVDQCNLLGQIENSKMIKTLIYKDNNTNTMALSYIGTHAQGKIPIIILNIEGLKHLQEELACDDTNVKIFFELGELFRIRKVHIPFNVFSEYLCDIRKIDHEKVYNSLSQIWYPTVEKLAYTYYGTKTPKYALNNVLVSLSILEKIMSYKQNNILLKDICMTNINFCENLWKLDIPIILQKYPCLLKCYKDLMSSKTNNEIKK